MTVVYRAIPVWPHEQAVGRTGSPFRNSYEDTISVLEYEVFRLQPRMTAGRYTELGVAQVIIGAGYRDGDIRKDGAPRADARAPYHPGVEVSFDSVYGRLTYATDMYSDWRANVRAIALGLEALRAVARYGVAKRGQQYAGFALLSAGPGREERGRQLVEKYGSVPDALRATHPDTGADADTEAFQSVMAYRKAQEERGL